MNNYSEAGPIPDGRINRLAVYRSVEKFASANYRDLGARGSIFVTLGIALAAVALIILTVIYFLSFGVPLTIIGMLASILPVTIVVTCMYLLNRWDRKPASLLILAFLWGAGVSTLSALLLNTTIKAYALTASDGSGEVLSISVVAPVVEEIGKGLFLLAIFVFLRKFFNDPLDGIVYAGLTAAGFAFMENILYFSTAATDNGVTGFITTFFMRGLLTPFVHITFTVLIGIGIGLGALYKGYKFGIIGFLIGLIGAIVLHSLWNSGTTLVVDLFDYYGFIVFYGFIEIPIFIALTIFTFKFLKYKKAKTFMYLSQYAEAGWFTQDELYLLGTVQGRRFLITNANLYGMSRIVKNYLKQVTYLADLRESILKLDNPVLKTEEADTLKTIVSVRAFLQSNMRYVS